MSGIDNFVEVYNALLKRGLDRCAEGVPMPGFEDGQLGYSPNGKGSWHVIRDDKGDWQHLITDDDPEVIAQTILAHHSAAKSLAHLPRHQGTRPTERRSRTCRVRFLLPV